MRKESEFVYFRPQSNASRVILLPNFSTSGTHPLASHSGEAGKAAAGSQGSGDQSAAKSGTSSSLGGSGSSRGSKAQGNGSSTNSNTNCGGDQSHGDNGNSNGNSTRKAGRKSTAGLKGAASPRIANGNDDAKGKQRTAVQRLSALTRERRNSARHSLGNGRQSFGGRNDILWDGYTFGCKDMVGTVLIT